MGKPVTAQRTKAPGRTTRKSPSRYLTSASPAMGEGRSERFSTLASTQPVCWDHESISVPVPTHNIVARAGACHPPAWDCWSEFKFRGLAKALRAEQAALIRIAVAAAAARFARGGGLR